MDIREYISSGIIELYAMGLCSDAEQKEFESLLAQHPELKDALAEFEADLEKRMLQEIVSPSSEADEKIFASFDKLMPAKAPVVQIKKQSSNLLKPFAIAASLLLGVAMYFIYDLYSQNRKLQNQAASSGQKEMPKPEMKKEMVAPSADLSTLPEKDYKIMLNPAITPVAMYGVGSHSICRCTMFWDKKTGKLYIIIHHLPQSSSARDYQLWAMIDNKPVSVGVIQDDIRGRFIEMSDVPGGALSFIVTLEKAGGNSNPTMDEIYLSGKI